MKYFKFMFFVRTLLMFVCLFREYTFSKIIKMKTYKLLIIIGLFLPLMACSQSSQLKMKSLNAQDFKKIIESDSVVLFDVRTKSEYDGGHVSGSINIDVYDPEFSTQVKSKSKGKSIALYCRSGNRSKYAASKLTDLKVQIYELNRGIIDWQQTRYPIVK